MNSKTGILIILMLLSSGCISPADERPQIVKTTTPSTLLKEKCISGDGICLEGCSYEHDGDCEKTMPTISRDFKDEMRGKLEECPKLQRMSKDSFFDTVLVDRKDGLVVLRFHNPKKGGYIYLLWSRSPRPRPLEVIEGLFWLYGCGGGSSSIPQDATDIKVSDKPVVLVPSAPASPVIASISVEGDPIEPFHSEGDLWMSTWADDGNLYSGWGDGSGVDAKRDEWTDCGIARFTGALPRITGEEIFLDALHQAIDCKGSEHPT
ncbi:hypothetical protein ACFLRC_05060 [Candidatus Altiarchaeota archaeon]